MEQCLDYAEHLKASGQGITNPGGYATTIYRTGEADGRIEEWLKSKDVPKPDVEKCPDCNGSGFIYPNGLEGGVKRCEHKGLSRA
jgi:hypothetical protein